MHGQDTLSFSFFLLMPPMKVALCLWLYFHLEWTNQNEESDGLSRRVNEFTTMAVIKSGHWNFSLLSRGRVHDWLLYDFNALCHDNNVYFGVFHQFTKCFVCININSAKGEQAMRCVGVNNDTMSSRSFHSSSIDAWIKEPCFAWLPVDMLILNEKEANHAIYNKDKLHRWNILHWSTSENSGTEGHDTCSWAISKF